MRAAGQVKADNSEKYFRKITLQGFKIKKTVGNLIWWISCNVLETAAFFNVKSVEAERKHLLLILGPPNAVLVPHNTYCFPTYLLLHIVLEVF